MPRERNIYDPASAKLYRLSRSKIELFIECPKCFYLDRRLGRDRIPCPGYTLNMATDTLLKKEFDHARADGRPHRLIEQYGIDAIPYDHPNIDDWRNARTGITYGPKDTNIELFGAVDDIWVNPQGKLIVVDYKSTSMRREIDITESAKAPYRRQIEFYQWLLRQNGFDVSDTGYFVYVNADTDATGFNGRLQFSETIIPYDGNDGWVDRTITSAYDTLQGSDIPTSTPTCAWCTYCKEVISLQDDHKRAPTTLFG